MAATDLCTLSQVLKYLKIGDDADDKTNDILEKFITEKTKAITNYIGYTQILAQDYTEYYDGDDGKYLFVYNTPIVSVASLYDDIEWDYGSDTLVDSDNYKIVDSRYIVRKDAVFNKYDQNIKITYNAGFATIPADLNGVCIEEVARSFSEKGNIGITSRSDSKGGVTRVEKGWMKQSLDVLNIYVKELVI